MFGFLKKLTGCNCSAANDSPAALAKRKEKALAQDKKVRESLTEKQIDKGLKDTMEASDPVAKY